MASRTYKKKKTAENVCRRKNAKSKVYTYRVLGKTGAWYVKGYKTKK